MARPKGDFNPKEILAALKWDQFKLSSDLADRVIAELQDPTSQFDKYTLIHVLGATHDQQYRPVVESFIAGQHDVMLARAAFFVLCTLWGLDGDYSRQLVDAAQGLPWDEEDDLRIYALGRLGHVVLATKDAQALSVLISVSTDAREMNVMRQVALDEIRVATGTSSPQRPHPIRPDSAESDRVIKEGRDLLASWAGPPSASPPTGQPS